MRSMRRGFWLLQLTLAFAPFALASDTENLSCRNDSRVVAACYSVHGRVSNWNGNPTRRIWVAGTKRLLGVRDGAPMPKFLEDTLTSFDVEVYGDFEFCPFKPQRPGVMQVGCVAKVANYQLKARKQ
jgi:hypothetical protein